MKKQKLHSSETKPSRDTNWQKQCINEATGKMMQLTLTHQQRIDIIHLSVNHGMSYREISNYRLIPFSTVRQTIQEFKKTERTNKLHTHSTKVKLLSDHAQYKNALRARRKLIRQRIRQAGGDKSRPNKEKKTRKIMINLEMMVSE